MSKAITIPFPRPQRSLCSSQTSSRERVQEEARSCPCCRMAISVGRHQSTSRQHPLILIWIPSRILGLHRGKLYSFRGCGRLSKGKNCSKCSRANFTALHKEPGNAVIPEIAGQHKSSRRKRRVRQRGRGRFRAPRHLCPSSVEKSANMDFENKALHLVLIVNFSYQSPGR